MDVEIEAFKKGYLKLRTTWKANMINFLIIYHTISCLFFYLNCNY